MVGFDTPREGSLTTPSSGRSSLRRKPPPRMDEFDPESKGMQPRTHTEAAGEERLRDARDGTIGGSRDGRPFTIEKGRRDGRESMDGESISYTDEFDESLISYESPKPKGPQTLPELEIFSTPPTKSPVGKYTFEKQAPYPTNDIALSIGFLCEESSYCRELEEDADGEEEEEEVEVEVEEESFHSSSQSPSKTSFARASPYHLKTSEIITKSLHTPPMKMPSLNYANSLKVPDVPSPHLQANKPANLDNDHNEFVYYSNNSPPRSRYNDAKYGPTDPTNLAGASPSSTRESSPVTSHTISIITNSSPVLTGASDGSFGRNNHRTRSSSPKKTYGRSPSLMYGNGNQFEDSPPNDDDVTYSEDDIFDDKYEEDFDESYLTSKAEKEYQDSGESKSEISDSRSYDDEITETPTSNYFDYSILPELPTRTYSNDPHSTSPSKRLTLNSTISFLKRDSNANFSSPSSLTYSKKRKNFELPPVPLDLPQLPFTSSSLTSQHFATCNSIWSQKNIFDWCLNLKTWLSDLLISKREFKKALIKLFVFYKRNVPLDVIGLNVDRVLDSLLHQKAIAYEMIDNEEENKSDDTPSDGEREKKKSSENQRVIFSDNVYVNGVLIDLTNCYCHDDDHMMTDKVLQNNVKLRCYSYHCQLNRVIDHENQFRNTKFNEIVLGDDWASHWRLTVDDLGRYDKNLSERQSLIFDLIKYEQTFIQRAKCFVEIVGPEFIKAARLLVGGQDIVLLNKFEDDVLTPGEELIKIHKNSLFEPLLRILISDGKFIKSVIDIGNIYHNWSLVVKSTMLKYMTTVPMIEDLLKNPNVKRWVDVEVRSMDGVKELKVNGPLLFLSTFNSRYQQLPLQLSDVRKLYDPQEQEYIALTKALDNIKRLGSAVNDTKIHADNKYELKKIHQQLLWKSNVHRVNLNLSSDNRRFFYRGDLTRKGDLKINSYTNHVILLDNFLLITEKIRNPRTGSHFYKVVENPLAIEMLLFEIKEREASVPALELKPITKSLTSGSLTGTSSSNNNHANHELDPSSFPFKVRNAGRGKHNAHTFTTKTERERAQWIKYLTQAKSNLCSRLKKTEPFQVSSITNTIFAYEQGHKINKLQVCAPSDPVYDVSSVSVNIFQDLGIVGDIYISPSAKNHIVFNKAISASSFDINGTTFYLVGTALGVYCSDSKNRWKRIAVCTDVTKISIIRSLNLVLVLSNKTMRCYSLNALIEVYYDKQEYVQGVNLLQEPVQFFNVGKHKDVTMVFCALKKGASNGATSFKVLLPETDKHGIFSTFTMFKRFYVQAECFGISIFNSSFAVHTNKGIEVLDLDKLVPRGIPDLPVLESTKKIDGFSRRFVGNNVPHPGIDLVRKYTTSTNLKPMGMYKLANNTEFLLVYTDFAIFTNKYGKLSRYSMLKFDFKAKSIAFVNNNLFLFSDEVLEVWSISDFVHGSNRLIQVITGKDIYMLSNENSPAFAMANPLVPGIQLVMNLQPKHAV